MSLIDKVKSAVPLASNPEPESNITAGDFDNVQSDGDGDNDSQSEGSNTDADSEEQSGSEDAQSSDSTNESSDGTSESESPGDETSDGDENSNVGDGSPGETDQDTEDTSGESSSSDPQSDPGESRDSESEESESSGQSQQSLFDYEDPEDWSDPLDNDSDNNSDEDDSDNTGDGDSDFDGDENQNNTNNESDEGSRESDDNQSDGVPSGEGTEPPNPDGEQEGASDSSQNDNDGESSDGPSTETDDGTTPGDNKQSENTQSKKEESTDNDNCENDSPHNDGGQNNESNPETDETSDDKTDDSEVIEPDTNSSTDPDHNEDSFEPHPDLENSEQNRIQEEKQELERELQTAENELKECMEALNNDAGGDQIGEVQFNLDPDSQTTSQRWNDAAKNKKRAARLLQKQLKESRRDTWDRGRTEGTLDSKRLHAVPAKRLDVMKQRNPGNKKKYSVIVVLDRSASMNGQRINIAESALVQYALAMEDLGIEICIMDMYQDNARIISPFGVDLEMSKGDLTCGETGGGTPLSDVIQIARKRMENSNQFPILISVTDGQPKYPEKYKEQLHKAQMPVMGITVKPGKRFNSTGPRTGDQDQYYDIHTYVKSEDELQEQLEKMTLEIPF